MTDRELLAHIEVQKIVIKKWAKSDYSEHTPYIDYPIEFDRDVVSAYTALKKRQSELTGRVRI
jgi:hypothetical protein